jgi:PIN domain nuclease of toxin-antitoxin system
MQEKPVNNPTDRIFIATAHEYGYRLVIVIGRYWNMQAKGIFRRSPAERAFLQ